MLRTRTAHDVPSWKYNMPCTADSETFGPIVVWSLKDTSTQNFFPLHDPRPSSSFRHKMRVNLDMENISGNTKIRLSIRMGNDGTSWQTAVQVDTVTANTNGPVYGTSFADMTTTLAGYRLAQLGIECVNNGAGGLLETCMASAEVDYND